MKRTNKDRVETLNKIISGIKDYSFGTMPKGYSPYCLMHKGVVCAGGYFKEVRSMAMRMYFANHGNRKIDWYVIFGE
jgi:hypothetical protein